ncbi:toprim domain-containing protein [Sedimentibacter sp. MB35-C1]|uniref:DUF3991 and TOPRIM domain-containing protein n=1 Tax=Sedimentibacter sp. MB35-C1 TaxID=3070995 RepID=UPI0027E09694|nr:DUF3991 and TOPRIM domain-containing protein [Sedimentibacter sp. MB35-C1]WMJ77878.1 toprim domain-containing protein [Sedimentibacter sp. MB35-C1]
MYKQYQINKAKNMDLLDYVRQRGYSLIQSAANEYRLKEHDSLVISNNKWKWFSRDIGGDTLDFVTKYEGKSFKDAMEILIGEKGKEKVKEYFPEKSQQKPKKDISQLPEKADNYRRLFAYLSKTRRIDPSIIQDMINDSKLYQEKQYNNCVFLGKDSNGEVKYCLKVGTNTYKKFKGEQEGSDKAYGVELCSSSESSKVYVYESIIDAMSHATMIKIQGGNYKDHNRISLGCVADVKLEQFLKDNPNIKTIISCLDNDKAGIDATEKIRKKYSNRGYIIKRILSKSKDLNEDLVAAFEFLEKQQKTVSDLDSNIKKNRMTNKNVPSEKRNKNAVERSM